MSTGDGADWVDRIGDGGSTGFGSAHVAENLLVDPRAGAFLITAL